MILNFFRRVSDDISGRLDQILAGEKMKDENIARRRAEYDQEVRRLRESHPPATGGLKHSGTGQRD